MAWNVKNPIDYSASGDDIDSFSLKVKNELEVIYELLNRLRSGDAGSGTSVTDAVAYSLRVDTSTNPPTIYMRNGQNTGYVAIGKLAENMGLNAESLGGVQSDNFGKLSRGVEADLPGTASSYDVYFATDTKRVYMYLSGSWQVFASLNFGDMENVSSTVVSQSEVAASGAGKIPRLDADSGEGQFSITGSAAKIQGYPINTPGLKSDQVLVYNETTKRWENKDRMSGVVAEENVATGGAGKVLRTDSSNVAHVDISGTAAKIAKKTVEVTALKENDVLAYDSAKDEFVNRPGVTLNSAGVADISITGNAAKVGGKVFQFTDLQDGQIPVYRESANAFVGENKGTVGVGKALEIVRDGKTVGSYDGGTRVIANVDTYGLRQNATTYGVGAVVTGKTLAPNMVLVCSTAGKSAEDEPDMSAVSDGASVTDGTAVWIVRAFETTAGLTAHSADTTAHADIRQKITDGDATTLASAQSDAQAKADAALASSKTYTDEAVGTHDSNLSAHEVQFAAAIAKMPVIMAGCISSFFQESEPFHTVTTQNHTTIASPSHLLLHIGGAGYEVKERTSIDISTDAAWDTNAQEWQAKHAYSVGDVVYPTSGHTTYYYRCVTAGTSSSLTPAFPSAIGETYNDGDVVWECQLDYTQAVNRKGKDFYIYAVVQDGAVHFVACANSVNPTGYSSATCRKVGGFHCECADIGANTYGGSGHWLYGYMAGDILPYSVWDCYHRPFGAPEGYVYVPGSNIWASIYGLSWSGSYTATENSLVLRSVNGGTWADGTSAEPFHCTKFDQILAQQGQRLMWQDEFIRASLGSNQGTAIKGAADPGTTGGHFDTAGVRMVSWIGLEDCCGALWQWGKEGAGAKGTTWANDPLSDLYAKGSSFCNGGRVLFGGAWDDGACCGSRASGWSNGAFVLFAALGARGASEPLNKDAGLRWLHA